ncbi:MAG TPA: hypothetical protein VG755_24340 [Nannocystaceae bacterium]|nr:hypothetical protein [Nannocystaceae bacterium]
MNDSRRRALVNVASAWAAKQGLFSVQAAVGERACVNAATYASLCAPVHASDRQLALATTFTVIFFWLDDADPRELAELLAEPVARMPVLSHWRADARELDACRPELTRAWSESLRIYLAALGDELALDRAAITVAQQLDLRRRNAFIDPYLDLWFALVDAAPLAAECARARWIGRELIIYANDLGSLDRDLAASRERPELNLAITMAREQGITAELAARSLVEQHDALCAELRALLTTIAAVAPAWAGVLREVVIGNVLAMRALAERYAGSTARLDALALPL